MHWTVGDRLPSTLGKNLDSLARRLLRGSLIIVLIVIVMTVMLEDVSHRLRIRVGEPGRRGGLGRHGLLTWGFRESWLLQGELGKRKRESFDRRWRSICRLGLWNHLCCLSRLIIRQGLLRRRICDACSFTCGRKIVSLYRIGRL